MRHLFPFRLKTTLSFYKEKLRVLHRNFNHCGMSTGSRRVYFEFYYFNTLSMFILLSLHTCFAHARHLCFQDEFISPQNRFICQLLFCFSIVAHLLSRRHLYTVHCKTLRKARANIIFGRKTRPRADYN